MWEGEMIGSDDLESTDSIRISKNVKEKSSPEYSGEDFY
jgi:hypothetical protein